MTPSAPSTPSRPPFIRMLLEPSRTLTGTRLRGSAVHPGGGVHGDCGANAARAALAQHRFAPVRTYTRKNRQPDGHH